MAKSGLSASDILDIRREAVALGLPVADYVRLVYSSSEAEIMLARMQETLDGLETKSTAERGVYSSDGRRAICGDGPGRGQGEVAPVVSAADGELSDGLPFGVDQGVLDIRQNVTAPWEFSASRQYTDFEGGENSAEYDDLEQSPSADFLVGRWDD